MRLAIILLFFLILQLQLPTLSPAEGIDDFETQIFISQDGTVRVEESIRYDFSGNSRHGIYREIPYRYARDRHNYNIDIDVTSVTDFSGNGYKYDVTRSGDYVRVRIGDPDRTVTGIRDYRIEYFVRRAVLFEKDRDVFYWNVTGNEWKVPVLNSTARVYVEGGTDRVAVAKCFTGSYGSHESNCDITETSEGLKVSATGELWGGDGLTILLEFPKGVIKEPSTVDNIYYFIRDNKAYSFPFITLAFMGALWYYRGRDPMSGKSVAVRYSPPEDMTPAEAGALYDERADVIDLTSTIIDLAVRGYIRIEEIETTGFLFFSDRDYRLIKLEKENAEELRDFERRTLDGLFEGGRNEVLVSELKNKFYRKLDGIKKSLYGSLKGKGYFVMNPEHMRRIYLFAGVMVILTGFFLFTGDFVSMVMAGISGCVVMLFSRFMPRKTKKGAEASHHLSGFREFIDRAEKDRIRKLASEDHTLFERMLPFALVFGLEEKWAEAFSDIFTQPPEWYVTSGYGGSFNSHIFINDLGRGIGVINKSLYSSPKNSGGGRSVSMSGGGFSGGGFGGGGGGSW